MKDLARVGNVCVADTEGARAEPYWSLFSGVWAHRMWAGEAVLSGGQPAPLTSSERLFVVYANKASTDEFWPYGAIYVESIDATQHRAAIHAALLPGQLEHGKALVDGLAIVGAVMAESFGIERFWTAVPPGRAHFAKLLGMRIEGVMRAHVIGPEGREDVAILGGLWREDMKPVLKTTLEAIQWIAPGE